MLMERWNQFMKTIYETISVDKNETRIGIGVGVRDVSV